MALTHLLTLQPHEISLLLTGQRSVQAFLGDDALDVPARVAPGDEVLIRACGGRVAAKANIHRVDLYDSLVASDVNRLRALYGDRTASGDAFWERDAGAAMFLTLSRVRLIPAESALPVPAEPTSDIWQTLGEQAPVMRRAA